MVFSHFAKGMLVTFWCVVKDRGKLAGSLMYLIWTSNDDDIAIAIPINNADEQPSIENQPSKSSGLLDTALNTSIAPDCDSDPIIFEIVQVLGFLSWPNACEDDLFDAKSCVMGK